MRITNNMMISNMMRNLNNHMINLDKLDNQASTGKRISKPSDDPVGMSTILRLSSDISSHEQYKKNIDESLSWLDASETAITQLKDALQRVRELTVRASNDTLTDEDRAATKKEISQLKDQIVSIGNTNFAGKFLFAGYNTLDEPFEEVEVDIDGKTVKRLKYNGKFLSPGGAVDPSIDDTEFKNFLINPLNKELTSTELDQDKLIEIGTKNYVDVNITGDELVQIGFLGTYDTLTRLEMALDKPDNEDSASYKKGFIESEYKTTPISGLDNSADRKLVITVGDDNVEIEVPAGENMQDIINENDFLKNKGIKVTPDGTDMIFSGDVEFSVTPDGGTATNATYVKHPIVVGERLEGTIDSPVGGMTIDVDGVTITIPEGSYNMDTLAGRNKLTDIIEDELKNNGSDIKVKMTDDNRLMFVNESSSTVFTVKAQSLLGIDSDTTAEECVIKEQELSTTDIIGDIDKNMTNILSIISDIGGKTNRLELDQKRIEDNILNFNKLLSKTQDVDMAETIMKMKMEESVYKAALSVGSRIIQPSLLDFLK
ncbi:flagellar hook-associated protein FlgL [Anaeromicrobium sediminis]|uniref:Flagellar hook-associated protein 3 n=1 Tax=Anaeromicrobium sediminis TaxID=1478221 RepID=A0A267MKC3_9FIRM|nr:flagellar hook-associated protein FlgL [Anaeromicrobium sediminis]PAB59368.1 flagellar hook-associated protein 3 [Anaeromicrobium sediminis]